MSSSPDTYLHGHHDSVLRSHRWRTAENSAGYLLPRLAPNGAGPRHRLRPGHDHRGPGGAGPRRGVIGLDAAADVLGEARQRRSGRGLANVSFGTGDIYQLAFADEASTWCTRTRCCSTWPTRSAALREMRRVCRPGGAGGGARRRLRRDLLVPRATGLTEWLALYRKRGPGARRRARRRPAPAVLGAAGRLRGQVEASGSAWCYTGARGPGLVGRVLGGPADDSPFGDRAVEHGLATAGRPGAAGGGLASVGGQRGRVVPHPARRDPRPGLTRGGRCGVRPRRLGRGRRLRRLGRPGPRERRACGRRRGG